MFHNQIVQEENNNFYVGQLPELKNSEILFHGKNNYIICNGNVRLENSKIQFHGDNSVVFLNESYHPIKINIGIYHNSVFYLGKNNYINDNIIAILSEQKHIFIGDDGAFSFGIWFRTADPHLIYDRSRRKRINSTKSIFVGDHVWIGQNVLMLKGTQIDSGSIIGGNSVVSGKHILNSSIYAGNPVRFVKDDIIWDDSCVHAWTDEMTELSNDYDTYISSTKNQNLDDYIFSYDKNSEVSYEYLDRIFSSGNIEDKINYLFELSDRKIKNRFVHRRDGINLYMED
jgi:acetyltransferase-like isoleucine patch superfamily enzyme